MHFPKKNLSLPEAAGFMAAGMKIRKITAITLLVLSSFAANGVAPSKTELEAMYDKAFKEFDSSNYEQALKDLDAIDARQPDLAESQNLRGVILMRQKDYANAEKALQKALAADPKFWNARFNLAEIPFLDKKWPEARKRFQELLSGNASELQGEATQLIQYKVLITYLMEGKDEMVSAMMAKFELNPDTPAVQYANAAISLHKKNEKEAKDALAAAEKNFSPQLNKLFAESLYEVGWLEKPAGQTRAALELNSQAERAAQTKAFAKAKFDEAELALQQRDLTAAKKLIDEADAADPNQAAVMNLRGEIFLEQKDYAQAETEFKKAQQVDPNFRDAQYNLAQVPFKKGDYETARDRFEALFSTTTGTDKDRAAQLIKFKVYLTLLLEGKDSRAQKMMEQFQFTGDTPALYYAQAAWEFKHDNAAKANDWVNSARKIYPLALNGVFADAFFDLGWLQSAAAETKPAAVADGTQAEVAPGIEPTPIPAMTLAQNAPVAGADPLSLAGQTNPPISGMEATTAGAAQNSTASSALAAASSPSVETPVASTASPAASRPVVANASEPEPAVAPPATAVASASPATVLAPAKVREWSEPSFSQRLEQLGLNPMVGLFVLAGILLLGTAMITLFRRRSPKTSLMLGEPILESGTYGDDAESVGAVEHLMSPTRMAGGPPQVSLQLRASEPALRRAVMPLGKASAGNGRGFGHGSVVPTAAAFAPAPVEAPVASEPSTYAPPAFASFDEGVGEPTSAVVDEPAPFESEEASLASEIAAFTPEVSEPIAESWNEPEQSRNAPAETWNEREQSSYAEVENFDVPSDVPAYEDFSAPPMVDEPLEYAPASEFETVSDDVEMSVAEVEAPLAEMETLDAEMETLAVEAEIPAMETVESFVAPEEEISVPIEETYSMEDSAPSTEEFEPIGQGQPVPYLTPAPIAEVSQPATETASELPAAIAGLGAGLAGIGALRHSVSPSPDSEAVSAVPMDQQTTTPAMPLPTQSTPAPAIRTAPPSTTPAPAGGMPAAQPTPGGMHTAVQLTFSFEIASLQLTPTFKMGAIQLKPTSKIVTMRLAPSQQPQPAMNLQVTFEIASVQLAGNSIGTIKLTPSQQQRPGISSSPAFNVAGLQLVAGAESNPVQITPSQQGGASVHVTAGFQIATVEFSPSFEIASIILNSTSRNVSVQLPGSGPSAVEGAPVFEVSSVQLGSNGELGTMQLAAKGEKKSAPQAQG